VKEVGKIHALSQNHLRADEGSAELDYSTPLGLVWAQPELNG